jgi:hypothetical protein
MILAPFRPIRLGAAASRSEIVVYRQQWPRKNRPLPAIIKLVRTVARAVKSA